MKNINEKIAKINMEEYNLRRSNENQVFDIISTPSTHEIQDVMRYIEDEQLVVPDIQRDDNA